MVSLEKYNMKNNKHLDLLKDLKNDDTVISNITSISNINNYTYIIKVDNNYIGIIRLNEEIDNNYSLDMGILKKYQNMGYGSMAMMKLEEIITDIWNSVYIRTEYKNKKAIYSSFKAGFIIDYVETEKNQNEGMSYLVLSKSNKKA